MEEIQWKKLISALSEKGTLLICTKDRAEYTYNEFLISILSARNMLCINILKSTKERPDLEIVNRLNQETRPGTHIVATKALSWEYHYRMVVPTEGWQVSHYNDAILLAEKTAFGGFHLATQSYRYKNLQDEFVQFLLSLKDYEKKLDVI